MKETEPLLVKKKHEFICMKLNNPLTAQIWPPKINKYLLLLTYLQGNLFRFAHFQHALYNIQTKTRQITTAASVYPPVHDIFEW